MRKVIIALSFPTLLFAQATGQYNFNTGSPVQQTYAGILNPNLGYNQYAQTQHNNYINYLGNNGFPMYPMGMHPYQLNRGMNGYNTFNTQAAAYYQQQMKLQQMQNQFMQNQQNLQYIQMGSNNMNQYFKYQQMYMMKKRIKEEKQAKKEKEKLKKEKEKLHKKALAEKKKLDEKAKAKKAELEKVRKAKELAEKKRLEKIHHYKKCAQYVNHSNTSFASLTYSANLEGNKFFVIDEGGNVHPRPGVKHKKDSLTNTETLTVYNEITEGPLAKLGVVRTERIVIERDPDFHNRIKRIVHYHEPISSEDRDKLYNQSSKKDFYKKQWPKDVRENWGFKIPSKTITEFKYDGKKNCSIRTRYLEAVSELGGEATTHKVSIFEPELCKELETTPGKSFNYLAHVIKSYIKPKAPTGIIIPKKSSSLPRRKNVMLVELDGKAEKPEVLVSRVSAYCSSVAAFNHYAVPKAKKEVKSVNEGSATEN